MISSLLNAITNSFTSQTNEQVAGAQESAQSSSDAAPPTSSLSHLYPSATTVEPPSRSFHTTLRSPKTRGTAAVTSSSTVRSSQSHVRPRRDPDERRLVGDYSRPVDAIYAPIPTEWPSSSAPMKPKPGASKSFKPVNTIGQRNPFESQQKAATYGRHSRTAVGAGQLAFLDRHPIHVDQRTSPRTSRHFQSHDYHAPKRRKTEHPEVVDLVHDDDEMEAPPPPPRRRTHSSPDQPISVKSGSQRSERTAVWAGSNDRQVPMSSFVATQKLVEPHRKSSRNRNRNGEARTKSRSRTPMNANLADDLLGKPSSPHDSSQDDIQVVNPETISRYFPPKLPPSNDFGDELPLLPFSDLDELQARDPDTVSLPYSKTLPPTARINPSTSTQSGTGAGSRANGRTLLDNLNLRDKFKRAALENIEDGEDEIQEVKPETARPVNRHSNSPTKSGRQANTGAKRTRPASTAMGWPLIYARSCYFSQDDSALNLKIAGPKLFNLVYRDNGVTATGEVLDLGKVLVCEADEVSRIRLRGSRDEMGNMYQFDLEFADSAQFKTFRNIYAESTANSKRSRFYTKPQEFMKRLFSKPLDVNDKVGSSAVVDDNEIGLLEARTGTTRHELEQRAPRRRLIDNLSNESTSMTLAERVSKAGSKPANTVRPEHAGSLSRPTRTTRTTRALDDMIDLDPPSKEKKIPYSQEHGLGPPWDRPLQYGTGRRRAMVNFTDLVRLDDDVFLNDDLIDFYLIYLFEQAKVPPGKVYFFNTHFYTTITKPVPGGRSTINYAGVERWTAREDIFSYDYIVVPINENAHWYLALICNVNNIERRLDMDGLGPSSPVADNASEPTVEPVDEPHEPVPASSPAPKLLDTNSAHQEDFTWYDEEEGKLNLVDADAVEIDGNLPTDSTQEHPARESPVAETTRMEELSLFDTAPTGIVGEAASSTLTSKKKPKRKVPALRKYDPDKPLIVILDSLEGTHPKAVRVLKEYILEEGKAKRNLQAIIEEKPFYVKRNHIPMQENYSDCGVFVLGYAQKFFADPRGFSDRLLSRDIDAQVDWPDMQALKMRDEMRAIILKLWDKQVAERKLAKKGKKSAPPAAVKTDIPAAPPKLLSPFQEQPPKEISIQAEVDLTPPQQASPVKANNSPPRSARKPSPIVLIEKNSPNGQPSLSTGNKQKSTNGHGNLYPPTKTPVDEQIRRPKRPKRSSVQPTSPARVSPEQRKASPAAATKSPRARKYNAFEEYHRQYPDDDPMPDRGSSAAPIEIDDSLDMIIVPSPKKRRPTSTEETITKNSPRLHKRHRSRPSIEKPSKPPTDDDEMLYNSHGDQNGYSIGGALISQLSRTPPGDRRTPRQARVEQAPADGHAREDEESWKGFDDEPEIPESPPHRRSSPGNSLSQGYSLLLSSN